MFMLRIRFDTFCTVPVIASSAPMRRANWISQPPQACRLLACASRAIGVISTSENRPESLSSCRNGLLRRASRCCSSGRAPRVAPSKLVSINSKSNTATDCATVGPQLTNNKAHSATTYDRMIMVGPLEPSARARVPDHLWLCACAAAASPPIRSEGSRRCKRKHYSTPSRFKVSPQEVLRHVDGFEETPVVIGGACQISKKVGGWLADRMQFDQLKRREFR